MSHPYNSAYMKLFQSFDKTIITLCQFYCGEMPFEQLLRIRTLNFYVKLNSIDVSPANLCYKWFGEEDFTLIASKYNVVRSDQPFSIREKIVKCFNESANALSF